MDGTLSGPTVGVCVAPLRSALRVWVCPYGVLVISTRLRQSIRRGGTRQRHFDGTNSKPRKLPDCEACARCPDGQHASRPPPLPWRTLPRLLRAGVAGDWVHVVDPASRDLRRARRGCVGPLVEFIYELPTLKAACGQQPNYFDLPRPC